MSECGLLLVGHGTRDPAGRAEFFATVKLVGEMVPSIAVEACFLELASPTIGEGVAALVRREVRRLTVVPVLLFAAGHAKHDIPQAVAAATAEHRGLLVQQTPALSAHPLMLELSAERYLGALSGRPHVPPDQTVLVMVGRGSLDREATDEMQAFSRRRAEITPVGRVETCFIAMAKPPVAAMLDAIAELDCRRIVVQPHLLFQGELLLNLHAQVEERASKDPNKEWIATPHLGPSPRLAQALADLAALSPSNGRP